MLDFLIHHASAADYQLLTPLPGIVTRTEVVNGVTQYFSDFSTYIPALVKLVIGLAGGFAVLRIIMGGFLYVSTDAFGKKSDAKETIQNALIGLLLAMSAYVILYTLNPKLVDIGFTLQGVGSNKPLDDGLGDTSGAPLTQCSQNSPCTTGRAATCETAASCGPQNVQTCTESSPCKSGILLCPDCIVVNNNSPLPHKPLDQACRPPYPCQIEEDLLLGLYSMTNALKASKLNIDWWVTEMYPATVTHVSSCHKNTTNAGKCVDATIKNATTDPDIAGKVVALSAQIEDRIKGTYQWEVPTEKARQDWLKAIDKWFIDNKDTNIAKLLLPYKASTGNSFVVNHCDTCTLHVHINSPNLEQ